MNSDSTSTQSTGWLPPRFDIADIFRTHVDDYIKQNPVSVEQMKAIKAIISCRTPVLGGRLYCCDECGHEVPIYNSCRSRSCPKCLGLNQAKWIELRKERTLPTHYFHVVFTMPQQMRPLAFNNRREIFDLLFKTAADTLQTLAADPKLLGAQLGITSVLHTWSRTLQFHPHVHCVVTGGGLDSSQPAWVPTRKKFLFPVRMISTVFRAKLVEGLGVLYAKGNLKLLGECAYLNDPEGFRVFKNELFKEPWVVYCKRPFAGPDRVFEYLGRYTHRVAISNFRLRDVADDHITFATKEGRTVTVTPHEFMRRFLQHVLPRGFQKIRHYGLSASANVTTKLKLAGDLLRSSLPPAEVPPPATTDDTNAEDTEADQDWREQLRALTGIDLNVCPCCRQGRMRLKPPPEDSS